MGRRRPSAREAGREGGRGKRGQGVSKGGPSPIIRTEQQQEAGISHSVAMWLTAGTPHFCLSICHPLFLLALLCTLLPFVPPPPPFFRHEPCALKQLGGAAERERRRKEELGRTRKSKIKIAVVRRTGARGGNLSYLRTEGSGGT